MAYPGITTKTLKDGSKNIYVQFKYLNVRYPEKNFTKLYGCKTERQAFEKLQEVKLEISAGRDPFTLKKGTPNEIFDELCENNLASGLWRPRTYETNTYFYGKYIRNTIGNKHISKITLKEIQDIYDKNMNDIKPYTRLQLRKVLKPIYERAITDGMVYENLAIKLKVVKNPNKIKKSASERVDEKFIDVARKIYRTIPYYDGYKKNQKEEIRAYLMLIVLTAHRHGELRQLMINDCHIEDGYIISREHITKTKRDYKFPIPAELIPYIQSVESGKLFPTIKAGSVDDIFQRLLRLTDIKVREGNRITLHDFRRFQLMIMIRDLKIDSALADVCLNHKRKDVMAHYEDFTYDDIKEAYELYWDYLREEIDYTPKPKEKRRTRLKKEHYEALKANGWEKYVPIAERIDPNNQHYRKPKE